MNSCINKNDARKQGELQKQPGTPLSGTRKWRICACRHPEPGLKQERLSAWLQKVKFSSAGQIVKLVKSSSNGSNALRNIHYVCSQPTTTVSIYFFYFFIFFLLHIISTRHGRTRLLSASWQVLGWIRPRGLHRLVGPTVTEAKLCPRADVCILQKSCSSTSWFLQRYALFTPYKSLWLMGLSCCFTARNIPLTPRHLEFKTDFVWHIIKLIYAFYQNYYWSILGFTRTHWNSFTGEIKGWNDGENSTVAFTVTL